MRGSVFSSMRSGFRAMEGRGKFVPQASFITGLSPIAWFRLGVGLTDDGGGLCSKWADQSGNGHDLTAAGAARPTIQSDSSLLFDGVANTLFAAAVTAAQPFSAYILMKQVSWGGALRIIQFAEAPSAALLQQAVASPTLRMASSTAGNTNSKLPIGQWGVVTAVYNSTASLMQVNEITPPSSGSAIGTNGMSEIAIAATGVPGNFSNIQVKELIFFSAAHDVDTMNKVVRYLERVGGLGA